MGKDILYQKVYNAIRDKVQNKELLPGLLLEPERSLMSEYDVSRVTIRKALSLLVKDGFLLTRPSVGYEIIDQTPKIKSKENLIGVILNDGNNPENFFMLSQLEKVLTINQYSIMLGFNKYNSKDEDECISRFMHLGLKGLIVSPATTGPTDSLLNKLIEEEYPIVLLGQPRDWKIKSSLKEKLYIVCEDNEKCIYYSLRHLDALGHEDICFVKPKDMKFTSIREKSFLKLRNKKSAQVIELENKYSSSDNLKLLKNLISSKKRPTAFIAYDNTIGFITIQCLQKIGISIPEDVSVISIGKVSQERLNQFPITNVEAMENEWGDKVFLSLESQIKKQNVAKTLYVNHELSVRGSTARVASLNANLT